MNSILYLIFSLFLVGPQQSENNCRLQIDDENIEVYLCETTNSPFKTIKVNFIAKTTLKEYAAGVLDIKNYKYWQSSISSIKILESISENELIYYSVVDTPWPISNRDLIFHLKMNQDPSTKTLTITLEQLPEYLPKKDGIVRIPTANSVLTVTPINATTVDVSYVIHVDPGGDIPAVIANLFAAQTPWKTFYNYRERLSSGKICGSHITFIENY